MPESLTNWAANYEYRAPRLHRPETIGQIQEIVSRATRVKALGTRHSFNEIADTDGDLVSTENLNQIQIEGDEVTIGAGVKYGDLCAVLHREGRAIHNLASLPHISVAGACATATHGSGDENGNLATVVKRMEIVAADGHIQALQPEEFVHLGALGIVTRLTLETQPTFELSQVVYEALPFETALTHFDEIESSAYSVSFFTHWGLRIIDQVWIKTKDANPPETMKGARKADGPRHPIATMSPVNCTQQLGVFGPWHERLPHFRMDFTPSSGEELQSEYLVPRKHAVEALKAIDKLRQQIAPHLQISEIRTIAADNFWLSPCYGQPCVGIHFTWEKDWPAVQALLPHLEKALEPFEARPHWGKLFSTEPDKLRALYAKLPEFQQRANALDPEGKFRNEFLNRNIL